MLKLKVISILILNNICCVHYNKNVLKIFTQNIFWPDELCHSTLKG